MGALTFKQVLDEGLLIAGNPKLIDRAKVWFNAWLQSQYAAFPFPFLLREKEGLPLAVGENSLLVGSGANGVTEKIRRVNDPVWLYDSAFTMRAHVRVQTLGETELEDDHSVRNPAVNRGQPCKVRVSADTALWGKWKLTFDRWADRAYLLKIDYFVQPAALVADADVPLYPNDRTMIQAVAVEALKFMRHEMYPDELEILSAMVRDDRVKYGEVPGTNEFMMLDKRVFR